MQKQNALVLFVSIDIVCILVGLLDNPNLSDGAYDWLSILKYHMEIRTVLRAKTESNQSEHPEEQEPHDELDAQQEPTGDGNTQFGETIKLFFPFV